MAPHTRLSVVLLLLRLYLSPTNLAFAILVEADAHESSEWNLQDDNNEVPVSPAGITTTAPIVELRGDSDSSNTEEDENDEMLQDWVAPKFIRDNFPFYVSGFDYDGRPIFIFEVGKYDYTCALARGGEEMERNLVRYWDQGMSTVLNISAQHEEENGLGEYALIYDFNGFSLEHVSSIEVRLNLKLLSKFGRAYERLGYGFILNANHVALALLNAARPLFGAFLERIEIYGTRKEVWLPKILRKFPRDQLPPWYVGGDAETHFTPVIVLG